MVFTLSVIAEKSEIRDELPFRLMKEGFACSVVDDDAEFAEHAADLLLVEVNGQNRTWQLCQKIRQDKSVPVIALVDREHLGSVDRRLNADDFLVSPYAAGELLFRVKRLLNKAESQGDSHVIRCGDLVIDQARCEVTVGGAVILLTFREYELLKFLAANPGRVFAREALLNKVWGYDYYGGDRTVDVHVRRLRSKIEGTGHSFIETVRNIGYRFREVAG